jgi:hypothetical protein
MPRTAGELGIRCRRRGAHLRGGAAAVPGAERLHRARAQHSRVDDPEKWPEYGPGAVGVGWDLTLLGLGLHLAGESIQDRDRDAWPRSPEATEFMTRSSDAWRAAHEVAGATATEAATASAKTLAAYAPHAGSDVS